MTTTDDFQDYVNIHEFRELIWDRIPEEAISNMYVDANEDFLNDCVLDLYSHYLSDRLTLNLSARLLHSFLIKLFEYKPDCSNLVDNYYQQ